MLSKIMIFEIFCLIIGGLFNSCLSDFNSQKRRVLFIGIDGLLKRCMNEANTTSFDYLKKNGSWTMNSRTIIETTSAPGWVSILCGMSSEESGVFDNSWTAPWMFGTKPKISPITDKIPFPCLFSELKNNNKNLILKVSWDWKWFINLGNVSFPGSIDKEYFCDPNPDREISSFDKCDEEMFNNAIKSLQDDFDLLFVYFISIDGAGHLFNFCSSEYVERISIINSYIEELFNQLKNKSLLENTHIVLTTDHGASYMKKWHGFQDDDNLITPFYMMGPGVKRNYELTKYIQTKDVASTIMRLFGYKSNPLWTGKVIEEAFGNSVNKVQESYYNNITQSYNKLKFLNFD